MARIPDSEIERLKKEVAVERLITGFGIELKRQGAELVSGVNYNSASQLTGLGVTVNFSGASQTMTYNNLMQMTGISGFGVNVTYNYTAGANNGRIASMTDSGAGETVTYGYDGMTCPMDMRQ